MSTHREKQIECGQRLADARSKAGLSIDEIAQKSRIPAKTLAALEAGDWDRLGASVFVRGQVRSYAKLLGLDAESLLAEAEVDMARPVALISHEHVSGWERFFNQLGMKVVYVVMTAGLAIPVYMAVTRSPVPEQDQLAAEAIQPPATAERRAEREPVVASMAALPKPAPALLSFDFDGESWVQFYAADGSVLEQGLMKAGDQRQFKPGELGRAVVGNAADVRISFAGNAIDMSPWMRSNVARFAVSSDGSPASPSP